ncbi:hypothetical protein [Siphonobacter sp. SORGH_AS_1065]|uniref:hypothetical protein n=1 Tax=Siphonobacter sp. SORGH_AS_1065 TaxID=3041795 RepID=UPI0027D7CA53|nr:hypothetical protein [Siphonobacter sp. SORGH_AS_1065]
MTRAIATSKKLVAVSPTYLPQHKLHVFLATAANMAAASFFAGSTNRGHEPIIMKRAIATSEKAGRATLVGVWHPYYFGINWMYFPHYALVIISGLAIGLSNGSLN